MRYTARVISGRGEGRKLGIPTINLEVPAELPSRVRHGVYAGWAWISGERLPAAIHYGPVPTFGIATDTLEVHIVGRDIPLAPAELTIETGERLRGIAAFPDRESLIAQ